MTDSAQDSHSEKADDQAQAKAAEQSGQKAGSGKGFGLSNFLIFVFGSVGLVFVGLAINYHTKGGYGAAKLALLWGIIGYVLFGVGLYFAYYEYVIKPARAAERTKAQAGPSGENTQSAPQDRPELFMEGAKVESVAAGKNPQFKLVYKNIGKATAYRIVVRAACSVVEADAPGPLLSYIVPDIGTGDPEGLQLLPPGEKQLVEQSLKQTFTEKEIKELNNKTKLLFFTGKANYEDIDGASYESLYCYMFKNDQPPFFLINCPGKYWPQDFAKSEGRERRAWMTIEDIRIEGFEVGKHFTIWVSSANVGQLPAIVKKTRINADFMDMRISYTRPMTLQDMNDANVRRPPGDSPVSTITPYQKISIPIVVGPVTAELFTGVQSRTRFLVVWAGVEYETRGAVHYTVFCAVYDPTVKTFTVSGGGLD